MDISTENPAGHRSAQVHADHIGNMGRYIYQIRNMLAWMLVIWLASIAAAVGAGIYLGAHSSQVASPDCLSQGGTNTAC
jgi:hypothetical protein